MNKKAEFLFKLEINYNNLVLMEQEIKALAKDNNDPEEKVLLQRLYTALNLIRTYVEE